MELEVQAEKRLNLAKMEGFPACLFFADWFRQPDHSYVEVNFALRFPIEAREPS